ncbi:MAG: hypothetical protein Q9184_004690 [Pyrenodesmia sp. 2 TL-2023]
MASIVCCDPWNAEAYSTLREHPRVDLGIRTPVYNLSLLHFAVAKLDLQMLKTIAADVPLSEAGRTALGHSILHTACLPLDETWVQMHSLPIFTSCRETRNLSEMETAVEGTGETIDVAATDVHRNTALHYLASHREINEELLDLLWDENCAEEAWRGIKNRYGFTAVELFKSGRNVVEEDEGFWNVVDTWDREKEAEKEVWEEKFRGASHALVQKALDMIEPVQS